MSIFLSEHLGKSPASSSEGWDGDRYRLVKTSDGPVLEWFSVWDDAASADRFAAAYKQIAEKRHRVAKVERLMIGNQPGVKVIDGENAKAVANAPALSATVN